MGQILVSEGKSKLLILAELAGNFLPKNAPLCALSQEAEL